MTNPTLPEKPTEPLDGIGIHSDYTAMIMQNLVESNAGLVRYWVNRYAFLCNGRGDVDTDDLFQAGCLALIKASGTFDSSQGAWSTWASQYIHSAIQETLGRKRRIQTASLDAPAYHDDPDVALGETLPDASIIPDDDRLLSLEIVETVRAAVDALPEDTAPVVRAVGLQRLSRVDAARGLNIPADQIRRLYERGLRDLRKNRRLIHLADLDCETCFHRRKGAAAFHSSGSSVVEDLVEWRLRREGLE